MRWGPSAVILNLMKTTARFATGSSKNSNQAVIVTADTKADAQAAIKLVQAWVKANGGRSKVTEFTAAPRYSSNLDMFYRARIAFAVAA